MAMHRSSAILRVVVVYLATVATHICSGSNLDIQVRADKLSLGAALADELVRIARENTDKDGPFTVAISGGSLPKILASGLFDEPERYSRQSPFQIKFDVPDTFKGITNWGAWQVFFADERVVPHSHAESNYKLCRETLFERLPLKRSQIHTIAEGMSAPDAAGDYQAKLESVFGVNNGVPRFDVVLLGMGPDGHTASLFPGHSLLQVDEHTLVGSITNSPKPPAGRITLTLPVLNHARNVLFVCTGGGKAPVLKSVFTALKKPNLNAEAALVPAARVVPRDDGKLTWFVDKEAAAQWHEEL